MTLALTTDRYNIRMIQRIQVVIDLTLIQYTNNVGTIVQQEYESTLKMYMYNRNVGGLPRNVNVIVISHRT